jgi:uncharacterized membrane protein YhaH (DUF805 family)
MDWKYLFTSREGRISRKPYWLATIVLIVISIVLQLILLPFLGPLVTFVISLPIFFAAFALSIKRAHDRDRPDWYVIGFYALLLVFQIVALTSDPMSPSMLAGTLMIPVGIWAIVMLVDLGFLRGTEGANRYGPDPLSA